MQGWQDLLTQILVGVMVNAIIGILCWLMKREILFFKRMMRVPRSLQTPFKKNPPFIFQRPLSSSLSLATVSNTSPFTPNKKKSITE